MIKSMIQFLAVGVFAVAGFSCSNADLESRLAKLEGRVAELEAGKKGTSSPFEVSSNEPAQPSVVEEVPSGPIPKFKWEEEAYDFGKIKEGDQAEHIFKFVNAGEAPLIISDATGSCGCTVPTWPKDPIPVGGSGQIVVKFNSSGRPGAQSKTVSITSNTYPKLSQLSIKATVAPKDEAANGPVKN